jgi:pimeloyl-ACP methyl ester carboxylesterase
MRVPTTVCYLLILCFGLSWTSNSSAQNEAAPDSPKTGRFEIQFTQSSPISGIMEMAKRVKLVTKQAPQALQYDISKESFKVYVPEDYDPKLPCGLFVWISAGDDGVVGNRAKGYPEVLKNHRLIWVGANNGGNKRKPSNARIGMGLDAVYNMTQQYSIDPNRIYIGGFSGGGSMATISAHYYPDVYCGAVLMGTPYKFYGRGKSSIDNFYSDKAPPAPLVKLALERSRFVVLSGTEDFNRGSAKCEEMKALGFRTAYFEEPGLKHVVSSAEYFEKGVEFLDSSLSIGLELNFEKAMQQYEKKDYGRAIPGIRAAGLYGKIDSEISVKARPIFLELQTMYEDQIAEIEKQIEAGETRDAKSLVKDLKRTWRDYAAIDITRLTQLIRDKKKKK